MHNVRKIVDDLYWVGANDRRLELFENIHPIPEGVSYNSYMLLDEKTVVVDTVDWSVTRQYIENIEYFFTRRHRSKQFCKIVDILKQFCSYSVGVQRVRPCSSAYVGRFICRSIFKLCEESYFIF